MKTTSLGFYTDTHIDKQVAIQLRQHGVRVIRCEDVGLAAADDETHLQYATDHELALITKDGDFRTIHFYWMSAGRNHRGIFFCAERNSSAIGSIVADCLVFYRLVEEGIGTVDEIANEFFEISRG